MEKRLLLAEDETAIARLLQDNLTYEGYRVELAKDGPEALRKVDEFLPDLVLLDLMLPRQSGFEVCETVSARVDPSGIP